MRDESTADPDDAGDVDTATDGSPVRVLELRIHGVNNTTPFDMLELPPEAVKQVDGDDLGSFWAPEARAQATLRRTDPDNPGVVPRLVEGVLEREAYSWGGLARTSVTIGSGTVGQIATGVARLGWALLLPFGLVNIAYWTRRLDTGTDGVKGHGRGAATSRLFGLLLTLLLVVTACEIAVDLFAYQCFGPASKRCAALPDLVDVLAPWPVAQRLALASLGPVLVLLGLRLLGRVSAARYEAVTVVERPGERHAGRPGVILSRPTFWRGAARAEAGARLHLAAGVSVVVLATAVPEATLAVRGGWAWVTAGLAAALLLAAAVVLALFSGEAADVRGPRSAVPAVVPLALSAAADVLLAVHVALLWLQPATDGIPAPSGTAATQPLPGLAIAPTALLLLGALVAGWAFFWRGRARDAGTLARHSMWFGTAPGVFLLLALATATMLCSLAVLTTGNWLNGIRATSDLMAGLRADACTGRCAATPDLSVPDVYVLFGAASVGSIALLAVGAAVIIGIWWKVGAPGSPTPHPVLRWLYWRATGQDTAPGTLEVQVRAKIEELVRPRRAASRWGLLHFEDAAATATAAADAGEEPVCPGQDLLGPTAGARVRAAIMQHAEVLVLLLAVVAGLAVVVSLVETARAARGVALGFPVETLLLRAGPAGITLIGAAVAGSVAGGGVLRGQRPLGIVWDLICVVPRAAHPLGPPCYAERAVPELVRRVVWHLTGEGAQGQDVASAGSARAPQEGRHVVLSAHSLGCALAIAAVNALPAGVISVPTAAYASDPITVPTTQPFVDRVSLITYGCQLRPYFSRIFPELFGADVLGSPPCGHPAVLARDPWAHQQDAAVPPPVPGSVRALLGTRWINLWRRTDYLGFPLLGWRPPQQDDGNTADRPAEEIDTSTYVAAVATHGNYPRTIAYAVALRDLVPGIDQDQRPRRPNNAEAA